MKPGYRPVGEPYNPEVTDRERVLLALDHIRKACGWGVPSHSTHNMKLAMELLVQVLEHK